MMGMWSPSSYEGDSNIEAYEPINRDDEEDRRRYQQPVYQRRPQQAGNLNLSDLLLAQDMMPQVKAPQNSGGSGNLNLTSLMGLFGG